MTAPCHLSYADLSRLIPAMEEELDNTVEQLLGAMTRALDPMEHGFWVDAPAVLASRAGAYGRLVLKFRAALEGREW